MPLNQRLNSATRVLKWQVKERSPAAPCLHLGASTSGLVRQDTLARTGR